MNEHEMKTEEHRVSGERVLRGASGFLPLLGLLLLGFSLRAEAQVSPRPWPAGVTDSSIAWGRKLFHGSANCAACHGVEGRGTDEGPALTGALWFHGPGTYEWLVEQIKQGFYTEAYFNRGRRRITRYRKRARGSTWSLRCRLNEE